MMEVGSPSLQNVGRARDTENIFSPEGRSLSVDTDLALQVPVGDNNGASMLPQDTGRSPSASNIPVSLPSTTIGGWTTPIMPHNSLVKPGLLDIGSAKEFDKGVLRDGGSGNTNTGPLGTEGTRVDSDDRLNMATQPAYLGESQSSQADYNNIYSRGETQLVHDNQLGLDDIQPPFSGDTQPVNDHEGFDDMVILQNNKLTASTIRLTNAGQSVVLEPKQGTDTLPLQDSFDASAFTHMGNICNNGNPASYESNASTGERETSAKAEGPNQRMSDMEVPPTVNEHPEVHPAETAMQLGLIEGKEGNNTNSSEPQLDLLSENVNEKGKADEGMIDKDGEAETGVKDDVSGKAKVVSDKDIQAIKGRKVMKRFGRKNYEGEVVDYDAENQWFKVVYEDGDGEDLELLEVKEILLTEDTLSNASTMKRKRSHPGGAVNAQLARKQERTPKKKGTAVGAQKKSQPQQIKSPPASKIKGLKGSAKSKSSLASAYENPVQSQPTSGAKRKRSSDMEAMTSSKLESENIGGKVKSSGNKESSNAKTLRKSSAKRGGKAKPKDSARKKGTRHRSPVQSQLTSGARKRISDVKAMTSSKLEPEDISSKVKSSGNKQSSNAKTLRKSSAKGEGKARPKNSARKKGTRHRSLSKFPVEESKVEKALEAGEREKGGKSKAKRLKIDASEDDAVVGKSVKKDFDGTLYSGVVAKFDKKTKYYKVKYEDGDEEEMELEELKAVLVQ